MEDERPIQPMKENDQNIDYISMDKLPVLSEDQLSQDNISLNLKNMIETQKWHATFDAIVFFRSVNKQNSSIIKKIISELIKYLPKLSNSIRSGISKEAIILVGEILLNYNNENSAFDFDIIKVGQTVKAKAVRESAMDNVYSFSAELLLDGNPCGKGKLTVMEIV
jgi:hypothetical protein